MSVINKEINHSLNALKCVAILAVICIHGGIWALGQVGFGIDFISRFAVPTFFLISGFYSLYEDKIYAVDKYRKRSVRLIYLIIISNIIYIVFFALTWPDYNIWSLFSFESCINYLLLNIAPGAYHLWFLQALLYCYLFFWAITKLNIKPNRLYFLVPILLAINLFLCEFMVFNGTKIHYMYYRNFLFTGLPFFLLGFYIRDKQASIREFFSNEITFLFITASFAVILVELSFITELVDLSIGSLLLSVSLFILCVNNPDVNVSVLSWIGGNLYAYMYILHLMVIKWVSSVIDLSSLGIFKALVYFICTVALSYAVYVVKNYYSGQKHNPHQESIGEMEGKKK